MTTLLGREHVEGALRDALRIAAGAPVSIQQSPLLGLASVLAALARSPGGTLKWAPALQRHALAMEEQMQAFRRRALRKLALGSLRELMQVELKLACSLHHCRKYHPLPM